jgi:predicted component of type VI protein secretion system
MPALLVPLTDGRTITLDKGIVVVGRHAECDIQILSPKISRLHCCIAQVGPYLIVRDLQSTNGIRVNGMRVLEGRLGAGDELTIGNHRYQVRGDVARLKPAAAHAAAGKPAAKVKPRVPSVDELEACDEPVPLPEPGGPRLKKAKLAASAKDAPPAPREVPNGRTEAPSVPEEKPSIVLPSEDPSPAPLAPPLLLDQPELAAPEEGVSDPGSHPSH